MKVLGLTLVIITLFSCTENKTNSIQKNKMKNKSTSSFTTSITVKNDISSSFDSIKNFRGGGRKK